MTIEQLKNAWNTYDKSVENKINLDLLKTVSIDRAKSSTRNFRFETIVEIVVSLYFVNVMAGIAMDHWTTWEYFAPAIVIGTISLGTVIWNVHALIQISSLSYNHSIAEAQKRMERIYTQSKWQNTTLHYLTVPLVGVMLAIMGLKFLNLNLVGYWHIILYAALGSAAVVPLVVWIVKLAPDKEMESAIGFLGQIKRFEEEGS